MPGPAASNISKTPLLSTAFFPPLEYMACIARFGKAIIELHESYPKQTWRNRCRIVTANGIHDLSVPVKKVDGNNTKTMDILISRHEDWQVRHWRAIKSAYAGSAYFLYYRDLFEELFLEPCYGSLWEMNHGILKALLDEMGIGARLSTTADFIKPGQYYPDLRFTISPKNHRPGGAIVRDWLEYPQVFSERHGFIPNLSIIDLIFNMGPDSAGYLGEAARQVFPGATV